MKKAVKKIIKNKYSMMFFFTTIGYIIGSHLLVAIMIELEIIVEARESFSEFIAIYGVITAALTTHFAIIDNNF